MSDHAAFPNLLFLFPDQLRWDWLGCMQSAFGDVPVRTPNIDRLAAQGVRFDQCRSNSPLCAPARASLAAGKRPHRTNVPFNGHELSPDVTTVFNLLRDHGYRTATCGKNDLQKHGSAKGIDGWTRQQGWLGFTDAINQSGKWDAVNTGAERPQDPFMAHLHRLGLASTYVDDYGRRGRLNREEGRLDASPSPLPRPHNPDEFCGAAALELLDRMPRGAPWMLWVNFPGPHEPFDPPAELLQRYADVDFPMPVNPAGHEGSDAAGRGVIDPTVQDHAALRRAYAAMIECIDEWVGRIVDRVARRGELDRTIVIFASDHGELLGDHGRWYKSRPEEGSVRVPLIVSGAGVARGVVSDALIELTDISATLLDLAGAPVPADWDARSFKPILTGAADPQTHRDVQVATLREWRMICDGRYKLIESDDAPPVLYDLAEDPCELRNVAEANPKVVSRLSQRLAAELGGAVASA